MQRIFKRDPRPLDDRRTALQSEVYRYIDRGYRVRKQDDTSAYLIRRRRLSCLLLTAWFALMLTGVWYFFGRREERVVLEVDDYGRPRSRRA
jgi:hypothetical protein